MSQPNNTFPVLFILVGAIVAVVFVIVVVMAARNAAAAKRQGIDPFTAQADIAAKLLKSDLLKPAQSKSERLAEVDALLAAGTISAEEHRAARAAILAAE
jgi:hypothetical protein